jgi:hypothetical protein
METSSRVAAAGSASIRPPAMPSQIPFKLFSPGAPLRKEDGAKKA